VSFGRTLVEMPEVPNTTTTIRIYLSAQIQCVKWISSVLPSKVLTKDKSALHSRGFLGKDTNNCVGVTSLSNALLRPMPELAEPAAATSEAEVSTAASSTTKES